MDEQTQRLIEQLKNNPSAIQSLIQSLSHSTSDR